MPVHGYGASETQCPFFQECVWTASVRSFELPLLGAVPISGRVSFGPLVVTPPLANCPAAVRLRFSETLWPAALGIMSSMIADSRSLRLPVQLAGWSPQPTPGLVDLDERESRTADRPGVGARTPFRSHGTSTCGRAEMTIGSGRVRWPNSAPLSRLTHRSLAGPEVIRTQ